MAGSDRPDEDGHKDEGDDLEEDQKGAESKEIRRVALDEDDQLVGASARVENAFRGGLRPAHAILDRLFANFRRLIDAAGGRNEVHVTGRRMQSAQTTTAKFRVGPALVSGGSAAFPLKKKKHCVTALEAF